ncbi:hypothetical protein JF540_22885 [Salipiger thiooxidans]|uniref:PBSX family phage terminase large subunit n=1 Tax=Salipiger thiooxidans TaxID=282683 RepID=UPI001A8D717A|nr:phage terminase large subunit [Salipiger thiooxidans]MBN8189535.1 hypothetical protein [Salipiger thiooxidans]
MTTARIELPKKLIANFRKPARHRVFKGGRGSGKTRGLAKMAAIRVYQLAEMGVQGVFLCSREHLNSLEESSMEEVKAAIRSEDWLAAYFDIGEKYIRTKNRRIDFVFAGLRHNLDSIKSKARIVGNWTDEAEQVSEAAWRKLIPTIREEGDGWQSENWVSYNPESPESATHRRFISEERTGVIVTEINWRDNPWFPDVLEQERQDDLRLRPDIYDHIWEGAFLSQTEAQVFFGKVSVREFKPGRWDGPYQGVDFGFRPDPLAAVRVWIHDIRIWIEHEAYGQGVEIDAMPGFIKTRIPRFEEYVSRADSAEPKTISYAKRNGLARMEPVKKWPNSVHEGIRWMRGFEEIVIHPRCTGTARDFRRYSHKTDRLTGDILPDMIDADNHGPDAVRYALAPLIKQVGKTKTGSVVGMY